MSDYEYQPVPKLLGDRIQELIQSLQVIRDSLEAVLQGKTHQIIPVYGQLRSLISEKSKNNHPLLLDIAKQVGFPLYFYCMVDADGLPEELKKNSILRFSGFPVTLQKEMPGQVQISIEKFLNHKIIIYKNISYSVKDIISFFANKAGGAHYSTDVPKDFMNLLSVSISGQPVLVNALLQIADIVYKLGVSLLKNQADFETHIVAYIPPQELKNPCHIIDNKYPESHMKIFYRLDPKMKLCFGVTSIQGSTAIVNASCIIDWSKVNHFTFSFTIKNNLFTRMSIALEGEEIGELDIPHPLFVVNNLINYESYHNRSEKDENDGIEFGMITIAMYQKLTLIERGRMHLYFDELISKEDLECLYFRKGQYGYAKPGTNDIEMFNSPIYWSIKKLLASEFPEINADFK
jgi:hypothetical protein